MPKSQVVFAARNVANMCIAAFPLRTVCHPVFRNHALDYIGPLRFHLPCTVPLMQQRAPDARRTAYLVSRTSAESAITPHLLVFFRNRVQRSNACYRPPVLAYSRNRCRNWRLDLRFLLVFLCDIGGSCGSG
jgi:hypothetical protein